MKKITAKLQSIHNPELGWVSISFPAGEEELNGQLAKIGVPISTERNCKLSLPKDEITPFAPLDGQTVNADELNYLAMRLDSFDGYEIIQFQAGAFCDRITDMAGLINLTFNQNNYTVADKFADIADIGKRYYFDEHLAASEAALAEVDLESIGYNLLCDGKGIITPFGVVFNHGKEPEMLYDGGAFPQYNYTADHAFTVGIVSRGGPQASDAAAWLYMPCPDTCISKAVQRLGAGSAEDTEIVEVSSDFTDTAVYDRFFPEKETLHTLNDLSRAIHDMDESHLRKLEAACEFAEATTAAQITALAHIMDDFSFYPGVHDSEQYGKSLITDSLKQYDEELVAYCDFEGYAEDRMANEKGKFTGLGYMVYTGASTKLDAIMQPTPIQSDPAPSAAQTQKGQDETSGMAENPGTVQEPDALSAYGSGSVGSIAYDETPETPGGDQTQTEPGDYPGFGYSVYSSQPEEPDEDTQSQQFQS